MISLHDYISLTNRIIGALGIEGYRTNRTYSSHHKSQLPNSNAQVPIPNHYSGFPIRTNGAQ